MTPVAAWCWFRCIHCWRLEPEDIGLEWDETKMPYMDDPEYIVERSIEEHKRSVSGYLGRQGVDPIKAREALKPSHVAISLMGGTHTIREGWRTNKGVSQEGDYHVPGDQWR